MKSAIIVTTFNRLLFDMSGKRMIQTFYDKQIQADLMVGHEGLLEHEIGNLYPVNGDGLLFTYDLDHDELLHTWLKDNQDIIPEKFGGKFTKPCRCKKKPRSYQRFKGHTRNCIHYGFKWRASCWFRKIPIIQHAWQTAKNTEGYDYIIFSDADIEFKQKISIDFIENELFRGAQFFYMKGRKREAAETSFFGFTTNRKGGGGNIWEKIVSYYTSGRFKKEPRWDDSWAVTIACREAKDIKLIDLGRKSRRIDIIHDTVLHKYVTHAKGKHSAYFR